MSRRVVLVIAASALLGGAARWMSLGSVTQVETVPATTELAEQAAALVQQGPCADLERERAKQQSSSLAMGLTRARVATLELERLDIAGEPSEWHGEPPAGAGPDEAEATLEAAAEAAGVRLVEIDCDEMPCVASIRLVLSQDMDHRARRDAMDEALRESLSGLHFGGSSHMSVGDGKVEYSIHGMLWSLDDVDRLDLDRLAFRQRAIGDLAEQVPYDERELDGLESVDAADE